MEFLKNYVVIRDKWLKDGFNNLIQDNSHRNEMKMHKLFINYEINTLISIFYVYSISMSIQP